MNQNPRSGTWDLRSRLQNLATKIQDPGPRTWNPDRRPRTKNLDPGSQFVAKV